MAGPPRLRWPAIVTTAAGLLFAEAVPAHLLKRYAGARAFRARLVGLGDVVTISDPDAVRELFAADPAVARAGEANHDVLGAVIGPRSLLSLDGDDHLRVRRAVAATMHGAALADARPKVTAIAAAEVARWPVGRPFALQPRMQTIALEVVLDALIGVRDEARRARLLERLPTVLGMNPFVAVLEGRVPALGGRAAARVLPWVRARREVEALLDAEIADHRGDGALAALLADATIRPEELRDQLMTLLLAGHDTTAATLAFAFERLVRHPGVLRRLQSELDGGEQLYLDAVVQETLRTRPPLDVAWRRLAGPLTVAGYDLPRGTLLGIAIRGAQRRPQAWDRPREFRPERFLGARPQTGTQIPFGGGPRRCVGAAFATMEMEEVLRAALARFELAPDRRRDEGQSHLRRFVTVPARGARVVATPRAISSATV